MGGVIAACHENDWRLVFALPRYAGGRCSGLAGRKGTKLGTSLIRDTSHRIIGCRMIGCRMIAKSRESVGILSAEDS